MWVDADELVVDAPGGSRWHHLNTIGEAAAFVGVEPGFPSELYPPATPLHVDEPLHLDRRAAEVVTAWNAFCAELLESFANEIADANPSPLILWPEHFDQAFYTEDADEARRANYGASPGDDDHPEPYLYVGPWGTPATNELLERDELQRRRSAAFQAHRYGRPRRACVAVLPRRPRSACRSLTAPMRRPSAS